MAAANSLEP